VGYTGKKQVNVSELKTAGQPVKITAKADRSEIIADGQDLSYITFEITDDKGVKSPKAENLLKFEISGPGKIVAVDNANPVSTESYQLPQRQAWQGKCMVIVKSGSEAGTITLKASDDSLNPVEVKIQSVLQK
jgi:beta-galactosidase